MILEQRFIPGLAIYSYLVGDEQSGEAAVVDPTRDVEPLIELARKHKLRITHILETHVHADFVSGSVELRARLDGNARIVVSKLGGEQWTPPYADETVGNGQAIQLGSVRLEAVHTPGHTPEHVCWAAYDETRDRERPAVLLTGDFLFVGALGRPDLLGKDAQAELAERLYDSAFKVLPRFDDSLAIYPGHGAGSFCGKALGNLPSSTVGYERSHNASLQPAPSDEWTRRLLEDMPPSPAYFATMKQVNRQGPPVLGPQLPGQTPIDARRLESGQPEGSLVLDMRSKEAFAAAHVPGSINIPLSDNLPTWAGWVLPYDRPLVVVADSPGDMAPVATHLTRVGLDNIAGYLHGGIAAWEKAGCPLASLGTLSVQELSAWRRDMTVLDVRSEGEWNAGHIDGAVLIHGGLLPQRFEDVPRGRPIAVICGSGYRASIAASLLQRAGFENVSNVLGGMSAWQKAGLPTVGSAAAV